MKKSTLFSNLLVAVFFASFVACGSHTEEAPAEEATEVVEEVVEEAAAEVEEAVDSLGTEAEEVVEEAAH